MKFFISFLSLSIGLIGIIFSGDIWASLDVHSDLHSGLTMTVAVFTLLSGLLVNQHIENREIKNELESMVSNFSQLKFSLVQEMKEKIPTITLLNTYTGDEALVKLSNSIKDCKMILNTRVLSEDLKSQKASSSTIVDSWRNEIMKGVKKGLIVKEVISPIWKKESQEMYDQLKNAKAKGSYSFSTLPEFPLAFINFTLLIRKNGEREVWFGWAMTKAKGLERECFSSLEKDLTQFFLDYHNDLCYRVETEENND